MNLRSVSWLVVVVSGVAVGTAEAGEIRGLPGGQAAYYNGYYGAAPSYAYAAPQTAYYAPAYQRGYPVQQMYYPQGVAIAPSVQTARVAYAPPPTIAYYAPASPGYAISPAGGAAAGSEAFPYYGQQQRLNYVPQNYYYQTRMMAVPVTYYRPVTVYQPGTVVPTTCQRACTTTTCQPQRSRLFNWFGSSCNSGACGSGATTCNYGSCAPASACGAVPYYNTVPGVTAPATVIPTTPSRGFNNILTPRTTVPPPATGVIGVPADTRPSISPSTVIPTNPPAIRSTTPLPPSSFNSVPGSGGAATPPASPGIFGSSFRSSFDKKETEKPQSELQLSRPTISEPGMKRTQNSEAPSTPHPVTDPDAGQRAKPGSRAPALIDPNDKTARARVMQPLGPATWAVVPARWPDQKQEVSYHVQAASAELANEKMVGSGDRSDKIRTYNFPDNRLTDHRIGLTLYKLDQIIRGDLQPVTDALIEHDRNELRRAMGVLDE